MREAADKLNTYEQKNAFWMEDQIYTNKLKNQLKEERERERQRDMWIACVACNAAFHIGEKRMGLFINALLCASQEWREMRDSADAEYADEKLRIKLEQICGAEIPYLFEDEAEKAKEAGSDQKRP